jgi:hypothetical protein
MCLITVAPKGTDKYSELLISGIREAAKTNTDGIGYAFKRASTKKVYISKGFTDIEKVILRLKKHRLKPDDELIIHQRIGNKGAKNTDMCHPFVLSKDKETILTNHQYVNLPVMAHNGTFHSHSQYNSQFSDTFWFVEEFMNNKFVVAMLKGDLEFFKKTFDSKLGVNRLAFLFPGEETNVITVGKWNEVEGLFFSNDSYKGNVRNTGGDDEYWANGKWNARPTMEGAPYGSHGRNSTDYATSEFARGESGWGERQKGVQQSFDRFHGTEDFEDDEYEYNKHAYKAPNPKFVDLSANKNKLSDYRKPSLILSEIIISNGVTIEDKRTNVKYRSYMEMWIPEVHNTQSQYLSIRFNPNEFNFNELTFKAVQDDDDANIKQGVFYEMITFDPTHGLHTLARKYDMRGKLDYIYMDTAEIIRLFEVRPIATSMNKYYEYYKLCSELQGSKTLLKDAIKAAARANQYAKAKVSFRGKDIHMGAFCMYITMLTKNQYPDTFKEELRKQNLEMTA